jgi:hypothetical protein
MRNAARLLRLERRAPGWDRCPGCGAASGLPVLHFVRGAPAWSPSPPYTPREHPPEPSPAEPCPRCSRAVTIRIHRLHAPSNER